MSFVLDGATRALQVAAAQAASPVRSSLLKAVARAAALAWPEAWDRFLPFLRTLCAASSAVAIELAACYFEEASPLGTAPQPPARLEAAGAEVLAAIVTPLRQSLAMSPDGASFGAALALLEHTAHLNSGAEVASGALEEILAATLCAHEHTRHAAWNVLEALIRKAGASGGEVRAHVFLTVARFLAAHKRGFMDPGFGEDVFQLQAVHRHMLRAAALLLAKPESPLLLYSNREVLGAVCAFFLEFATHPSPLIFRATLPFWTSLFKADVTPHLLDVGPVCTSLLERCLVMLLRLFSPAGPEGGSLYPPVAAADESLAFVRMSVDTDVEAKNLQQQLRREIHTLVSFVTKAAPKLVAPLAASTLRDQIAALQQLAPGAGAAACDLDAGTETGRLEAAGLFLGAVIDGLASASASLSLTHATDVRGGSSRLLPPSESNVDRDPFRNDQIVEELFLTLRAVFSVRPQSPVAQSVLSSILLSFEPFLAQCPAMQDNVLSFMTAFLEWLVWPVEKPPQPPPRPVFPKLPPLVLSSRRRCVDALCTLSRNRMIDEVVAEHIVALYEKFVELCATGMFTKQEIARISGAFTLFSRPLPTLQRRGVVHTLLETHLRSISNPALANALQSPEDLLAYFGTVAAPAPERLPSDSTWSIRRSFIFALEACNAVCEAVLLGKTRHIAGAGRCETPSRGAAADEAEQTLLWSLWSEILASVVPFVATLDRAYQCFEFMRTLPRSLVPALMGSGFEQLPKDTRQESDLEFMVRWFLQAREKCLNLISLSASDGGLFQAIPQMAGSDLDHRSLTPGARAQPPPPRFESPRTARPHSQSDLPPSAPTSPFVKGRNEEEEAQTFLASGLFNNLESVPLFMLTATLKNAILPVVRFSPLGESRRADSICHHILVTLLPNLLARLRRLWTWDGDVDYASPHAGGPLGLPAMDDVDLEICAHSLRGQVCSHFGSCVMEFFEFQTLSKRHRRNRATYPRLDWVMGSPQRLRAALALLGGLALFGDSTVTRWVSSGLSLKLLPRLRRALAGCEPCVSLFLRAEVTDVLGCLIGGVVSALANPVNKDNEIPLCYAAGDLYSCLPSLGEAALASGRTALCAAFAEADVQQFEACLAAAANEKAARLVYRQFFLAAPRRD